MNTKQITTYNKQERKCLYMNNRELAKNLIDQIPESKLFYVISYLQGAAVPEEIPNAETIETIAEVEEMIKAGSGQHFQGTTDKFTDMLLSET